MRPAINRPAWCAFLCLYYVCVVRRSQDRSFVINSARLVAQAIGTKPYDTLQYKVSYAISALNSNSPVTITRPVSSWCSKKFVLSKSHSLPDTIPFHCRFRNNNRGMCSSNVCRCMIPIAHYRALWCARLLLYHCDGPHNSTDDRPHTMFRQYPITTCHIGERPGWRNMSKRKKRHHRFHTATVRVPATTTICKYSVLMCSSTQQSIRKTRHVTAAAYKR